eukprot:CAMPEP_0174258688 /NCGR_PEP_ID=MMETSP0439-20130205/7635_1 /TAXON_ID=0 /ORGANISM="Stereomyxa ramosa, Strain Chinc5" /LENGTH=635 /DNA_ID=CAMNT_0015342295 /DNA_START=118 /DNA_END=2025 /DNA_ORIENTATION=+
MYCASKWVDLNEAEEEEVEWAEDADLNEELDNLFGDDDMDIPNAPPVFGGTQQRKKLKVRKANTNVVAISLDTINEDVEVATGEPEFCSECSAAFSCLNLPEEEEIEYPLTSWKCVFCNCVNEVDLEEEEIVKEESVDYMLEAAPMLAEKKDNEDERTLLFVIDISGSMCVSTAIEGKHSLKGNNASSHSSFNVENADQWAPNERRDVTWVSRLQSVQAAVETQLDLLEKEHPNRRVALITFNDEVTIYGDGDHVVLAGDKLNDYEALLTAGQNARVEKPISETRTEISKRLFSLSETGPTALGPAILVACGLAGETRGAEIVLCTDGLSNVGLGHLEGLVTDEEERAMEEFYEGLGQYAVQKGTTINVLSIKGDDCAIENLGALTELTNGMVDIVDPANITQEFSSILSDPLIATNVSVKFIMHRGLYICSDDNTKNSVATKEVGNIIADSKFSFEYGVRPKQELQELVQDLDSLKNLPFQLQIYYTKLDGTKCIRLISKQQPTTWDTQQAEKDADIDILGLNAIQQAAEMAQEGNYSKARLQNFNRQKVLRNCGRLKPTFDSAAWASKGMQFESELKSVQVAELDDGLCFDDACDDDRFANRAARKKRRQKTDSTANFLYNIKSKRANKYNRK